MESKWNDWHQRLKVMLEDGDEEEFQQLMEARSACIREIENQEEQKEVLSYFLEKDKELTQLIIERKNGIKQLLLTQNSQLKAVKKYDKF